MCKLIKKILCIFLFCFSLEEHLIIAEFTVEDFDTVWKLPLFNLLPPPVKIAIDTFAFLVQLGPEKAVTMNDVLTELKVVHSAIDRLETLVNAQPQKISSRLIDLQDIKDKENEIRQITDVINDMYADMMRDLHDEEGPSNETLKIRAIELTYISKPSLLGQLRALLHVLVPSDKHAGETSILEKHYVQMATKMADGQWCDNSQSFNEYLARRYRVFSDTMLKGYILVAGAYGIRQLFGELKTASKIRQVVQEYYTATRQINEGVKTVIAQSPLSVRRCDPSSNHQRGKTFIEFERLIQGYLVHKHNLKAARYSSDQCESLTASEENPTVFREKERFTYFARTTCSGSIYNCRTARAGSFCPSTTPSRRYEGFRSLNRWGFDREDLGNVTCGDDVLIERTGTWEFPDTAESCGCLCDDTNNPSSFRKINQHPVWTDYKNNMVATGFRLVNDSNTLYLEIKQGKLEEYGFINKSTTEWRPREQYITSKTYKSSPIQLSKDLRSINLNIATVPLGLAIVGAGFTVVPAVDDRPSVIELGIFTVPVSYATGKLLDPLENLRYDQPKSPKSELKIREPTIPTLAAINKLNMGEDKFIKLQSSDWKKDAAQTVVPFLDIQEVVTDPPTLLGGLGFSYRSADGYGGFIGLELQTWNYTRILFGPFYNETEFAQNPFKN